MATTCGRCTGGRPHGPGSSWSASRSVPGGHTRPCCSTPAPGHIWSVPTAPEGCGRDRRATTARPRTASSGWSRARRALARPWPPRGAGALRHGLGPSRRRATHRDRRRGAAAAPRPRQPGRRRAAGPPRRDPALPGVSADHGGGPPVPSGRGRADHLPAGGGRARRRRRSPPRPLRAQHRRRRPRRHRELGRRRPGPWPPRGLGHGAGHSGPPAGRRRGAAAQRRLAGRDRARGPVGRRRLDGAGRAGAGRAGAGWAGAGWAGAGWAGRRRCGDGRRGRPRRAGMSGPDVRSAVAAAAATLLGACALTPVYTTGLWFPPVFAVVAVVLAGGLLLRLGGAALWGWARPGRPVPEWIAGAWVSVVPLGQLFLVLCLLTARFAPTKAFAGVLPTPSSVAALGSVLSDGSAE